MYSSERQDLIAANDMKALFDDVMKIRVNEQNNTVYIDNSYQYSIDNNILIDEDNKPTALLNSQKILVDGSMTYYPDDELQKSYTIKQKIFNINGCTVIKFLAQSSDESLDVKSIKKICKNHSRMEVLETNNNERIFARYINEKLSDYWFSW